MYITNLTGEDWDYKCYENIEFPIQEGPWSPYALFSKIEYIVSCKILKETELYKTFAFGCSVTTRFDHKHANTSKVALAHYTSNLSNHWYGNKIIPYIRFCVGNLDIELEQDSDNAISLYFPITGQLEGFSIEMTWCPIDQLPNMIEQYLYKDTMDSLRRENEILRELVDKPDGAGAKFGYEAIEKVLS